MSASRESRVRGGEGLGLQMIGRIGGISLSQNQR